MRSRQQLVKVSVLATAFLLAVVLGNVSLRYIPVSFAQVSLPCPFPAQMKLAPGLIHAKPCMGFLGEESCLAASPTACAYALNICLLEFLELNYAEADQYRLQRACAHSGP